ncbi:MAG: GNAT family N-acetyltransferase [Deltaproteobacteria bacterium]|nr:GNAT family N-acetyltransferase [Deltaproteobacteria bacterium]TLN00828.1 MAG: GNAT family N-acetyltransferase [bacterium]
MTLKIIISEDDKRWDQFVENHPKGSIYHHSAWKSVLQSTFGFIPFYVAEVNPCNGRFEGILPCMRVKSRLTGTRLVSLPFTSYCAQLFPETLVDDIVEMALQNYPDTDYLELKFYDVLENESKILQRQSTYNTHVLHLTASANEIFKSFHNTSVCQRIKRGAKYNLKLRTADNEKDLKLFYDLHTKTRKKHGLPPHPYLFFQNMWKILMPHKFLLIPLLEYQGKIIAGAIVLKFKNTFHFEYSAFDLDYADISPNHSMIWETIKIAIDEGAKIFDFGRTASANKSLMDFKKRWATEEHNLQYYYYPEAKRINTEEGVIKYLLTKVNSLLPPYLLRLEGEVIYPHLG